MQPYEKTYVTGVNSFLNNAYDYNTTKILLSILLKLKYILILFENMNNSINENCLET